MKKEQTVLLAGKRYELSPHVDGRPGWECWPTQVWAWPGILR